MMDRRFFLSAISLTGILSFLRIENLHAVSRKNDGGIKSRPFNNNVASPHRLNRRLFIAHRGVHLKQTIAGENSFESIRLAKRAGFDCVEFDVRLSLDGTPVVMHDETLNRTVLNVDGSELAEEVNVSSRTIVELKNNYVLKAKEIRNRTTIPTVKEFLEECKKVRILPFIEIKLDNMPDQFYKGIIKMADEVMGKNNYVITSNNQVNTIVRSLGINDVTLMGILYQTTFEEIEKLGNVIMAISAVRFTPKLFHANVARANLLGIPTESHADDFYKFSIINDQGVDYVSTDVLAPDYEYNAELSAQAVSDGQFNDFHYSGKLRDGMVALGKGDHLRLKMPLPSVYFGGVFLEIELQGHCSIELADQNFSIKNVNMKYCRHQILIYDSSANFIIEAKGESLIKQISFKVAEF